MNDEQWLCTLGTGSEANPADLIVHYTLCIVHCSFPTSTISLFYCYFDMGKKPLPTSV